jgi:hypothetical protein
MMAGYCIIPGCKNAGTFDGYCDDHLFDRYTDLLAIVRRYIDLHDAAFANYLHDTRDDAIADKKYDIETVTLEYELWLLMHRFIKEGK